MEVVIPMFALSALYVVSTQSKNDKRKENFANKNSKLPNVNIANRNFPDEYPIISSETDETSKLSTVNRFENSGVYTDKYFTPSGVSKIVGNSQEVLKSAELSSSSFMENGGANNYMSLTGENVDSSYFQHNNMVPYFGSNIRNSQVDTNNNESVLDNYVGSGSQHVVKTERSPLFAPVENQQWAYGAPNMTDFYQSRVNPSMRMANVNPFSDEKVAPGLGLGYTTQGSNGFNSGMMMREAWTDRGVDDLRVANKQKATGLVSLGYEGPANSYNKQISTSENIGRVEKNRANRDWEWGEDRLFTTTGRGQGETSRAIQMERETARQTTTSEYIGGAGYGVEGEYIAGEYMPSHNNQLGDVPIAPANAQGRQYANDADFGIKSKKAYPNNRSENQQETYYGMISGGLLATVAPLLDVLRPSRKENVVGNLRPYQNMGTAISQSYIFNPSDRPQPTIRETTENSKFHMNTERGQRGGAYEVTDHQPAYNQRDTTTDFFYSGTAGGGDRSRKMKSYEAEYNQHNNDIKSSTINGYTPSGNMKLLNGDIYMRQANRDESLINNRPISGNMPYQSPEVSSMGKLQGSNELYQNIQLDRTTSDFTSALNSNPYVVNYKNAL